MGQVKIIARWCENEPMRTQHFKQGPIKFRNHSPSVAHPQDDDGYHYSKLL